MDQARRRPRSGATRDDPDAIRAGPDSTRADPDSTRADPGATRDGSGATRAGPDSTRADAGATRADPDSTRADPDSTRADPGATRAGHDSIRGDPVPSPKPSFPLDFILAIHFQAAHTTRAILPPTEEGPDTQKPNKQGTGMSHLDSEPPIFFDDGIFFDEPPPATPKHTMAKILRNWSKLGRKDRLALGKKIKTNLGKTPAPVAAPVPTVSALDALYTPAETLMNEMDDLETQLKAKRPALDAALDALMAGVEQEARTIEAIPDVTDATILAVGFAIAGVPQPAPAIAAPVDVSVTASSFEGGLDWHSHPLAGSTGMQPATTATPNDNASWVTHDTVPQSNGTVTGLPSGTRQYLRLRGIFPSGPGPWSDIAGKMVP